MNIIYIYIYVLQSEGMFLLILYENAMAQINDNAIFITNLMLYRNEGLIMKFSISLLSKVFCRNYLYYATYHNVYI